MIKVDKEKCIGCGACTSVSTNFEMKDGKAVVKDPNSKDKSNKEAEDICPVKAVIIK